MEVASPAGRRTIAARDFFDGMWSTNIEPDELLVGVSFPTWGGARGFAVEEFARRHGDFAIAGATIGIELDGGDRIARCAIGLIGLGSTPERADAAEAELAGRPIAEIEPEEVGPPRDGRPHVGAGRPARLRGVPHARRRGDGRRAPGRRAAARRRVDG